MASGSGEKSPDAFQDEDKPGQQSSMFLDVRDLCLFFPFSQDPHVSAHIDPY